MKLTFTYGDSVASCINGATSYISTATTYVANSPLSDFLKKLINNIAPIFPDQPSLYSEAENIYDGFLMKAIGNFFKNIFVPGLPTLITLAVVACAFSMMLTGDISKWGGRAMMIFWVGAGLILILK